VSWDGAPGGRSQAAKDFLASLPEPRYRFFALRRTGEVAPLDASFQVGNVLAIPELKMGAFPDLE
jgi:hypothetical protein